MSPARLFAENFLSGLLPRPDLEPYRFDSDLQINVAKDGQPAVLSPSGVSTSTITEVQGEHSDADPPEPDTRTITFVQAEGTDAMGVLSLGTRTTVHREDPDDVSTLATRTETKISRESSDVACS